MNAESVAKATGARVSGADGAAVDFSIVGTDSRSVKPGQLFVALHGERFDGNLRRIDLFGGHSEDRNDTLNWIGGKSPDWFNDAFARSGGSVLLRRRKAGSAISSVGASSLTAALTEADSAAKAPTASGMPAI